MDHGDAICRDLQRRGYTPTRLEVGAGRIYIQIDFMDGEGRPWTKAFYMIDGLASASGFEAQIREWKASVRASLREGTPSQVVRDAIGHFGSERVMAMLEAA